MASQNFKARLDLSSVSAEIVERITVSLQDGLARLFLERQHKSVSGLGRFFGLGHLFAEIALTEALMKKEQALADRVQYFMGEGLYRYITQQQRPEGFPEWSEFSAAYRKNIARYTTPAMMKVRRWLTKNGYRSYRDYLRDRAYMNSLTSGEAESLLRRYSAGKRVTRYDDSERKEVSNNVPLIGTFVIGKGYGAKAELLSVLKSASSQTRYKKHKELLESRIRRLRRASTDLLTKPYGYQSGAFAQKFRELPVVLKFALTKPNQNIKLQVRTISKRLASVGGGVSLKEAKEIIVPGLQLEWGAPTRLPRSMQALLYGRWSRFQTEFFPLYNQKYAAAALLAAMRKTFRRGGGV